MISLPGGLAITADRNCYRLGRSSKGGERLWDVTYHNDMQETVRATVRRLMRKQVEDGTITTLRGWLDEYKKITDEFTKRLEPLEVKS